MPLPELAPTLLHHHTTITAILNNNSRWHSKDRPNAYTLYHGQTLHRHNTNNHKPHQNKQQQFPHLIYTTSQNNQVTTTHAIRSQQHNNCNEPNAKFTHSLSCGPHSTSAHNLNCERTQTVVGPINPTKR